MEKLYLKHHIQHEVLGLASRLYSLGVGPKAGCYAPQYDARLWVEWAVWLLGGGVVFGKAVVQIYAKY